MVQEIKESEVPSFYRLDEQKRLENWTVEKLKEDQRNLDWALQLDLSHTNADIQQSETSQKLDMDAILELKHSGLEGKDIIKGIIENNENFEKRTEFSKEKYINKKKRKYELSWNVELCNVHNMFQYFLRTAGHKEMMYAWLR